MSALRRAGASVSRPTVIGSYGCRFQGQDGENESSVIARSNATKQSILSLGGKMDCFAGARNDAVTEAPKCPTGKSVRGVSGLRVQPLSQKYFGFPEI
jgi:hypothetical protein